MLWILKSVQAARRSGKKTSSKTQPKIKILALFSRWVPILLIAWAVLLMFSISKDQKHKEFKVFVTSAKQVSKLIRKSLQFFASYKALGTPLEIQSY